MHRENSSHKGENGKVAIIGGSHYQHGAPLFSALAAEASGVDLLYIAVPECHADIAKSKSLNFQVHPLEEDDLSIDDCDMLLELLATVDTAVIGPGLARTKETIKAVEELIAGATCTLILDATALQPNTLKLLGEKSAVLTPHLGELERMEIAEDDIEEAMSESSSILLLKNEIDTIYAKGRRQEVKGGNAGLTVGGTGDALAGLTAGLIAQGMDPFDACVMASGIIKRAGDLLQKEYGYAYGTARVIEQIPQLLHAL